NSQAPSNIKDVFDDRPIVVNGRYSTPGPATVVVSGLVGGEPWSQTLKTNFSSSNDAPAIASLWARHRVAELSLHPQRDQNAAKPIEKLGLDYSIMTPYTSFAAVEETQVNKNGVVQKVRVPIADADGVTFGGTDQDRYLERTVGRAGLISSGTGLISGL